jgi:hypothetical protein
VERDVPINIGDVFPVCVLDVPQAVNAISAVSAIATAAVNFRIL